MKSSLILVCSIGLCFVALRCGNKEITHHTEFTNQKTEQYLIEAKYPVFNIEPLNKEVEAICNQYIEECKVEATELSSDEWFIPLELKIKSELKITSNRYVSVNLQVYYYTGGAHGMTYNHTLSYDTESKSFLTLKDIIKGEQSELEQLVRTKLKKQLAEGNFVDDPFSGASNLSRFVIANDGIMFFFNPYEVAAYMYGTVSTTINYKEFEFNIDVNDEED